MSLEGISPRVERNITTYDIGNSVMGTGVHGGKNTLSVFQVIFGKRVQLSRLDGELLLKFCEVCFQSLPNVFSQFFPQRCLQPVLGLHPCLVRLLPKYTCDAFPTFVDELVQ